MRCVDGLLTFDGLQDCRGLVLYFVVGFVLVVTLIVFGLLDVWLACCRIPVVAFI